MGISNYDSPDPVQGQTWSTDELVKEFEVVAFAAPFCKVKRRADGIEGYMEFKHSPRVYFGFRPA